MRGALMHSRPKPHGGNRVGRTANLVYNWTDGPLTVTVPGMPAPLDLGPHEYHLV